MTKERISIEVTIKLDASVIVEDIDTEALREMLQVWFTPHSRVMRSEFKDNLKKVFEGFGIQFSAEQFPESEIMVTLKPYVHEPRSGDL